MRTPGWLLVAAMLAVGETINPGTTTNIPSYSSPTTTTTTTTIQNVTSTSSSANDDDNSVVVGPSAGSQDPPAPKDTFTSTSSTTTLKIPPTEKKRKQVISGTASASLRRIKKEYKDVVQMGICYDWVKGRLITSSTTHRDNKDNSDVQFIVVGPLATNLRHWHFSFRGVKNSLYESGIYHGRILLPKDYPKSPPRVQLMTPSGRFKTFADICLSASAFHPESWTPQWTVLSLVHGLRLHMLTNPQEIGGVMSSADDILEYARRSRAWKFAWIVGTTKIVVDHATLIEQGALAGIDEDHNNELGIKEPLKLDSERTPMTSPDRIRRHVSAEVTSVQQCALDAVIGTGTLTSNDSIAKQEIKLSEKNEKKRRRSLSHSTASPLVKTQHTIGSSKWVGRISLMVSKALTNPVARSLLLLVVVWIISKQ